MLEQLGRDRLREHLEALNSSLHALRVLAVERVANARVVLDEHRARLRFTEGGHARTVTRSDLVF